MNYKNYFLMLGLVLLSGQVAVGMEYARVDCLCGYAEQGQLRFVESMINRGRVVQVDAPNRYGRIALGYAAQEGHVDVVECLVERGANIELQDAKDLTPFHYAAQEGHVDVVRYFIEQGANIDVQDSTGWTPLHWAARRGHRNVVQLLIESGANVNIQANDRFGWTPLFQAAAQEIRPDVACLLIDNGADLSTRNNENRDFWAFARERRGEDFVRMIKRHIHMRKLQRKLNVTRRNISGKSGLRCRVEDCSFVV